MKNRIVAIVPARGGSKGVSGKNIKMLAGKPLILHTLDAARESGCFEKILVTTDSEEIRDIVLAAGHYCPDLRPGELSKDKALMIDVLKYCIEKKDYFDCAYDSVCLLQPTSPFRSASHIKEAVRMYGSSSCDTLVSVTEVPHRFHPSKLMVEKDGYLYPVDKDAPPTRHMTGDAVWGRNGPSILILETSLLKQGLLYGDRIIKYEMNKLNSIDIDDEADWLMAESLADALMKKA